MSRRLYPSLVVLIPLVATASVGNLPDSDVIRTPHFVIEYDETARGAARRVAAVAEARRSYVLRLLQVRDEGPVNVVIVSTDRGFSLAARSACTSTRYLAGLAFPDRRLVVLSARNREALTVTDTFVHELTHIYLPSAVAGNGVPMWFDEGLAMLAASEDLARRMKTVLRAALGQHFLQLDSLRSSFPHSLPQLRLAYAQAALFVRFLVRKKGLSGIRTLLDQVKRGVSFPLAFVSVYGASPQELFTHFIGSFGQSDALIYAVTSSVVLWALIAVVFLLAYGRKRRQIRRRMAELEDEDVDWTTDVPHPIH